MTLQEFWDELNRHDWYSSFSDSYAVTLAGDDEYKRLQKLANGNVDRETMLIGFRKHMFSGKPWKTPKQPKPERPA